MRLAQCTLCSGLFQAMATVCLPIQSEGGPLLNYRRLGKIEHSPPIMEEAIFSPDGKFMWTGSQWIPALRRLWKSVILTRLVVLK